MRLLDRYLFRELLAPLLYCLGGFLLICIFFSVTGNRAELAEKKLTAGDMFLWHLVSTPEILVEILPISLLLALLFALTTHARHHEITAIRSAGVSLWRLAVPYFAVGIFSSLLVFALNELWIPDIGEKTDAIEARHLPPKAAAEANLIRDFGFSCSPEGTPRTWLVGTYDTATGDMTRVQLDWVRRDGTRRWLAAEAARFTNNVWTFFQVVEFRENPAQNIHLAPTLRTNRLELSEITETPDEIHSAVKIQQRLRTKRSWSASFSLIEIRDFLRLHPRPTTAERDQIYTALHGRLAAPWCSLVVVFIALPFGAASGRRNIFAGVAASIVLFFGMIVVQKTGLAFGTAGILPPWLAGWLPILTFGTLGLWLSARVR